MQNDIAIKVTNLSKSYKLYDKPIDRLKESLNPFGKKYSKEFYALSDVSFEIQRGDTVGIIGKNGSGKSTLLKIITGVVTPTLGNIEINGKISALLELGAGFNPELTGLENIYMNGAIMGYSHEDMDSKVDDILKFADIGDYIYQPVKMYSSGMFARLAFAVSISVEPDILIVDEALSVGDAAFQTKCVSKMKQMMKNGTTILFVTHDMSIIKSFCKKCIYLQKGEIKTLGNAEEIADLYLSEIRADQNKSNLKIDFDGRNIEVYDVVESYNNLKFKYDANFEERVNIFREGTGQARITAFELLDTTDKILSVAEFNQTIKLRIYLRFYDNVIVGLGYHIRDDKNIELIGSTIRLESNKMINGKENQEYIIDFVTKVPLMEGNYNITLVVSAPANVESDSVLFVDLIENAEVFKVNQRKNLRIWNKVYIPAEVQVNLINKSSKGKWCPCCGNDDIEFLPLPEFYIENQLKYGYKVENVSPEMLNKEEYSCSKCGAADRERAYALWMRKNLRQKKELKILDVAPAITMSKFILENIPQVEYKTADLFMQHVDYKIDIMDMKQIPDNSFDFFICSHVLEHVKDDVLAMKELKRILKKDGCGILVVPLDLNQKEIDEDPHLEDIGERWRRFGQDDHIRKYSKKGFLERIAKSGLKVREYGIDYFGKEQFLKSGLADTSTIYIVWKGEKYEKI